MKPNFNHVIFKKIRYKDNQVILTYEDETPHGNDKYTMESFDEPAPEFKKALSGLAPHVIDICELSNESPDNISVLGVSLSDTDGITGVTITALKNLVRSNAPLVLNTPHKPYESYTKDGDDSNCLTDDQIDAVETLVEAARDYLRGKRAQGDLFSTEEAA
ncbi:MAG: hypothetical protein K9N22_03260 [Candidatus Marinimicrobia bacterium]|nr:hypothetical protein [Candidatus Neomarinimicrobiota bacterium]